MATPQDLYRFHVENLRAVSLGLDRIARLLRKAISEDDAKTESTLIRTYALLLGAWAETRLHKLLFEPQGFSDADRKRILAKEILFDRWTATVNLSFRKHYSRPRGRLSESTIPHSAFAQYTSLMETLDRNLRSIIELRNRLAHGQWVYLLNNEGSDVNQAHMAAIRSENLLSLQFKKSLLDRLSAAIHDLMVSKPTFERDFDHHFHHLVEIRRNLEVRKYQDYRERMKEKLRRGRLRPQPDGAEE